MVHKNTRKLFACVCLVSRAALLHCVILVWLLGDVSKLATMGRGCGVGRKLYDVWAWVLVCLVGVVCDGRSCWVDGEVGCFKVVVWYGGPHGPLVELVKLFAEMWMLGCLGGVMVM